MLSLFLVLLFVLFFTPPGLAQTTDSEQGSLLDDAKLRALFLPDNLHPFAESPIFIPVNSESFVPSVDFLRRYSRLIGLNSEKTVLIIGRGTGFSAAYMAARSKRVLVVELDQELREEYEDLWPTIALEKITSIDYREFLEDPNRESLDLVFFHGVIKAIPALIMDALADGGVILAPLSDAEGGQNLLIMRKNADRWRVESGHGSSFPSKPIALPGSARD